MSSIPELLTLAMLPLFLVLDLLYRARRFANPRWWRLRACVVTAFTFVYEILYCTYHRAAHTYDLLWRARSS